MRKIGLFFILFWGISGVIVWGEGKEYTTFEIEVQNVLSRLKSEERATALAAVAEIVQLAYQDKWGLTAQAVPALLELLKEELPGKQFIFIEEKGKIKPMVIDGPSIQIIQALGSIGDKTALPALKEIAESGPSFVSGELIRTEAGYARQAIQSIEKRKEFEERLKNLSEKERVNFLLSEIKKMAYLPANELLFLNLIINYLTELGEKAVPGMLALLNEALDIDSGIYKGEVFYTSYVYLIIPKVLGNRLSHHP
ncbi:MAG: hypothetical protein NC920_03970 [Candidatus Omnitrophica bacterium]|nr:hypothetical protein [Candidatus Omnitrophota bacterium]